MLEFHQVDIRCNFVPILHKISVTFQKGEITTVIGPTAAARPHFSNV